MGKRFSKYRKNRYDLSKEEFKEIRNRCMILKHGCRLAFKKINKIRRVGVLPSYVETWRRCIYYFLADSYFKKNIPNNAMEEVCLADIVAKNIHLRYDRELDDSYLHFFFCSLQYKHQIILTEAQVVRTGQEVVFKGNFSFQNLMDNFIIRIQVWHVAVRICGEKFIPLKGLHCEAIGMNSIHLCDLRVREEAMLCGNSNGLVMYLEDVKCLNVRLNVVKQYNNVRVNFLVDGFSIQADCEFNSNTLFIFGSSDPYAINLEYILSNDPGIYRNGDTVGFEWLSDFDDQLPFQDSIDIEFVLNNEVESQKFHKDLWERCVYLEAYQKNKIDNNNSYDGTCLSDLMNAYSQWG